MTQQVQELIDKIKSEGVEEAQRKAKEIEDSANEKARQVLDNAKREAEQMRVEAKEDIKRLQESTHAALKQASRDTLLSIRKEIEGIMQKIVAKDVGSALSADQLGGILSTVLKELVKSKDKDVEIQVVLSNSDQKKLKDGFLSKLKKEVKHPIKLQVSDDISKGFTISFDEGKSSFDFTDESLANFIGAFVNAQVAELLRESL